MTDYSNTIADLTQQQLAACSDSGLYPRDAARLEIDAADGLPAVSVRIHRYYTPNDAVPAREWHGLTLVVDIAANANIDALRETLADGGEASELIDRVIAGHGSRWNGNNYVGTLTDDARDALDNLKGALAGLPTSNWGAMDVRDYLAPLTAALNATFNATFNATRAATYAAIDAAGLTDQSGPDAIAAAAARLVDDAAVDRVVLTGDVVRHLTRLVETVRADAHAEKMADD